MCRTVTHLKCKCSIFQPNVQNQQQMLRATGRGRYRTHPGWGKLVFFKVIPSLWREETVGKLQSCACVKATHWTACLNKRLHHLLNVQNYTVQKAYEDTEGASLHGCKQAPASALKQTLFMLTRGLTTAVTHSSV